MATAAYVVSHTTALAAGLAAGLVGAGMVTKAAVPQAARAVVEFRAGAAAAATVETFVGNRTCSDVTAQLEGCTPSEDLSEVTLRWPRDGVAANRIRGVATYRRLGTWKRNGGSGVQQPAVATAEFIVGTAAASAIEDWLTTRACADASAQLGDCDIAADVREVTFRWERQNTAQPLQVIVALQADGSWVRGAPQ